MEPGDKVVHSNMEEVGVVESIENDYAMVKFNGHDRSLRVPVADLEKVDD